ncbi:MAG: zinc-ribbon domain-containing protein [Methanobrevibacter sp.]
MVQCPNCGWENRDDEKYCHACGSPLPREDKAIVPDNPDEGKVNAGPSGKPEKQYSEVKPVLLSFFISGLGQVYLGFPDKGYAQIKIYVGLLILILVLYFTVPLMIFAIFVFAFLWWLQVLMDAYATARALNEGIEVEDKLDFHNLDWWEEYFTF